MAYEDDPAPLYDRPSPAGLWAIVMLAVALCLVLGSSLIDLQRANATLTTIDSQQVVQVGLSHKGEAQLNALARGTQQLADGGDANAQAVVAILQRNGVHITDAGANR